MSLQVRQIPKNRPAFALSVVCVTVALCSQATIASAQVDVLPGQTVTLGGSDVGAAAAGGEVKCSIGGVVLTCFLPEFAATLALPDINFVNALHNQVNSTGGLALPHLASARIRNDFRLLGPPDTFVTVQLSVTYQLMVDLFGAAAYECMGELSLIVEDVTEGTPIGIGSVVLFRQDRSGDQGFTDVTIGREVYIEDGEVGSLSLLLQRGRTYRVWFQAEAMGEQFVVGNADNLVQATLRRLVVRVDEDEVEQLSRIEEKIDDIAQRVALIQRTQLEQALVSHLESRTVVMHTDRREEACQAAQEAIDSSKALGYPVHRRAQELLDEALAIEGSDPKRAVKLCRAAYRQAAFEESMPE